MIAAITSCTNTSNPAVMIGAGLLAKKAVERGLTRKPWVKTSLAPGSKRRDRVLREVGLDAVPRGVGFHTVGYGCTTCIGNSGPLPEAARRRSPRTISSSVRSSRGNRNFEARVHQRSRRTTWPLLRSSSRTRSPAGWTSTSRPSRSVTTTDGDPVYLDDIWPSPAEVQETIAAAIGRDMFLETYANVYEGEEAWRELPVPTGELFAWEADSTYVRRPPYFEGMTLAAGTIADIAGARCLVSVGDSVTTDHISPAGSIKRESPAGEYLVGHGVERADFNSYGSRRGNHEVMVRGTFANVRLRNLLVPGLGGDVDGAPARRRRDDDLRRRRALPRRGHADDRARGQGVRLRVVARLGGEGAEPARRQGRDRRELRADPPLEPPDDGDPAAAVPARREPRVPRSHRPRGVLRLRARERRGDAR